LRTSDQNIGKKQFSDRNLSNKEVGKFFEGQSKEKKILIVYFSGFGKKIEVKGSRE